MKLIEKIAALPYALTGRLFSDPERNGEYRFARKHVRNGMVVFDIGANIGEYSTYLLGRAPGLKIHCFEPVGATFATLQQNLRGYVNSGQVVLNQCALGEARGGAEMFVYQDNAGSNSLYFHDYHAALSQSIRKETVPVSTVDDYIESLGEPCVGLMKVDVEGHEFDVIRGAAESLRCGRIECIQFEYNNYWRRSGHTLLEMFTLLRSLNDFSFYRLTPWGRLPISHLDARIDDFRQSNYLAFLKQIASGNVGQNPLVQS